MAARAAPLRLVLRPGTSSSLTWRPFSTARTTFLADSNRPPSASSSLLSSLSPSSSSSSSTTTPTTTAQSQPRSPQPLLTPAERDNSKSLAFLDRLSSQTIRARSRAGGMSGGGGSSARDAIRDSNEIARLSAMVRTTRRQWKSGDVYAPHDLTPAEARKWRRRQAPSVDVFRQLAIDPLAEWKNPAMMYEFQTTMGRIKGRKETGLTPVNQRKIAKAIRRAIGMGFLPSVHAHPEILRRTKEGINYQ